MPTSNINYHLSTTALEEFWSKKEKNIFLGEWCKLYGKEYEWKKLEYTTLNINWNKPDNIKKTLTYLNEIYEIILLELTKFLNNYHGIQKDSEYYNIILGNWLYHYIHQLYDKYINLKFAFKRYSNLISYILNGEQYYFPLDYKDYNQCNNSKDEYALQIYSQIVLLLGYRFPIKKLSSPLIQPYQYVVNPRKSRIKDILLRNITLVNIKLAKAFNNKSITITNPYFNYKNIESKLQLLLRSRFKIIFDDFLYNNSFNYEIDYKARDKFIKIAHDDEFSYILSNTVLKNIPVLFLELYNNFRDWVLKLPIEKSSAFFTSNGLSGTNNIFKFYCAEHRNQILILNCQHGGGYGTDNIHSPEAYERFIADIFYTSGWSDSSQTIPLSIPKFYKKINNKKKTSQILFTINEMSRYVNRIQFYAKANTYYYYKLPSIYNFINELELREKLLIRISPLNKYGWKTQQRLKDKFSYYLNFDNFEKKFDKRLEQCCLFVSSGANTTYLEALAANKPTVIFLNRNISCFREQAQPYMDQLEKVGILHWSGEDAAEHINNIYNDLDNWWLSREVQKVRNGFVSKYARCNKNWPKEWADEFNRVLNIF